MVVAVAVVAAVAVLSVLSSARLSPVSASFSLPPICLSVVLVVVMAFVLVGLVLEPGAGVCDWSWGLVLGSGGDIDWGWRCG